MGGGKALDTLDERESRSSLAGVFMAAALEGVAMFDFSKEVLPYLDELPPSVGNVVSRVHLPAIAEAQAATAPAQGVERICRAQPERECRRGRIPSGHPRAGGGCVGSRAGARPAGAAAASSRCRAGSASPVRLRLPSPRRAAHPPRRA